jgi:hypothetical protein
VDFEWPWCPERLSDGPVDLRLHLGDLGPFDACPPSEYRRYAVRASATAGEPPTVLVLRGSDGHLRIRYSEGAEFVIDANAREIFGVSRAELTLSDLLVYLQGPVLGFALRQRGETCLHASAVAVNGRAFAVVGDAGMGKSTSAAAFARMGLPVLTDDVAALKDLGSSFRVQPGLPRVLLWPESVEALWGNAEALPQIVPTWPKRYLDLRAPGYRFAAQATPLQAIYVLSERLAAGSDTRISSLQGAQALVDLVANTYANDLLDATLRARELTVLGRLVSQVPVRRVQGPQDRAAIGRICQSMLADFEALQRDSEAG